MPWVERPARGRLAAFVERLWLVEDDGLAPEPHVICPDGRMELVLHLGDRMRQVTFAGGLQPRAIVAGQITSALTILPTGRISMVGARFAPGAFHACLRDSQSHFTDRMVDCDAIFPVWTRVALERIASVDDTSARLEAFERALDELIPSGATIDPAIHGAITALHATGGRARISRLCGDAGLSRRQFERRFRDHVGLPPRLFGRIVRFQRAFQLLGHVGGAGIAAECGYVDQAHLVREMRRFSGQTPTALATTDDELTQFFRQ